MKKQIWVKGYYNCEGGVQEMEVTKVVYEQGVLMPVIKEVIFEGEIKDISETDCDDEIDNFLKERFKEDGFVVKLNVQ